MKHPPGTRRKFLVGAALIVSAGLAALYLTSALGNTGLNQPVMVQVYYAAESIPLGSLITSEMLGTFAIPQENVADVMFEVGEEEELIGKLARFNMDKGVLITAPMVISPESLPLAPPLR